MWYRLSIAFIIGLIFGSFLNVLIYRLPRRISIINPSRSFCPNCKAEIKWYDNIPVLSYILLSGKCRVCGWKIPIRYPIVELLTGLCFLLSFSFSNSTIEALTFSALAFSVILLTFVDLEFMMIPDTSVILILVSGIIYSLINGSLLVNLITSIVTFSILFLVRKLSKNGIGFGDVKLFGVSGFFLGPIGSIVAMMIASLSGIIFVIVPLFMKKIGLKTKIPFGPFLGWGIFVTVLLKPLIIRLLGF